jgi:hypothetical protein
MLRILGTRKRLCDGVTRRDFLQIGGLGLFGLTLADALGRGTSAHAGESAPAGKPAPAGKTFDPKPLAPAEIQGEMKDMASVVPGLRICDRLPGMAQIMDRVTVIRSMTHPYPVHWLAYAVTGMPEYSPELETRARDTRHWPFMGSIVDYLDQQRHPQAAVPLPRNIGLPWMVNSKTDNPAVNAGPFAAFLGPRYDPVWTDFDGEGTTIAPPNTVGQTRQFRDPFGGLKPGGAFRLSSGAELPEEISVERLRLRRSLLEQFDRQRQHLDQAASVAAFRHQQQTALSLLTSNRLREALDIAREPAAIRDHYGRTLFGQGCLAARRLIESGARFVTVFWDCFGQFANGAWDTHQYHYPRMKDLLLPSFDLAFPALIRDLEERGLLEETLVIWMSEHGRTPQLSSQKPGGGREHWSRAYSALVAGGGTAAGKIVGATTPDGGEVAETPVSPKDIQATAYHLLGIDPHTTVPDALGRPHPIAGSGQLRRELLA